MEAFIVTAFAYEQTSSDKTYTMWGYNDKEMGLIPLTIQQVFDYIKSDIRRSYSISVSFLEVCALFSGLIKLYLELIFACLYRSKMRLLTT